MASDYFLSRDFRSATWAVHFVETYLKRVHKLPIASVHAMDSDQLRIAIRQDSGPRKVLHFDLPSTAQHFSSSRRLRPLRAGGADAGISESEAGAPLAAGRSQVAGRVNAKRTRAPSRTAQSCGA